MEGIRESIKKASPDERLERLRVKDKVTKKGGEIPKNFPAPLQARPHQLS